MKKLSMERTPRENTLVILRIFIIAFVLFYNAITSSFLDALLPELMVTVGVASSTTASGQPAAWIVAGFCFGRFLSASLWGNFIDKYGRKTGLMLILYLLTACVIGFGVCTSYYQLIAVRFVTGFINGLSIVGKTISMEVCPDDMKSWSISLTNSIWTLGGPAGPILASYFYNKIEGYPSLATTLAISLIGVTLIIICLCFIEETLPPKNNDLEQIAKSIPPKDYDTEIDDVNINQEETNDNMELVIKKQETSRLSLLNIPNVAKIVFIFAFNTFYSIVFNGMVIFWVSAKYEDGGLNFDHTAIAEIFVYFTIPQLTIQIFGYPLIQKKIGDYLMLQIGHWIHIPVFLMIPIARMFGEGNFLPQKLWIVLLLFIRNIANFMNFSALQRFTNDIIVPNKRGKLNGLQVSCSSGLQITAPFLGKWLLSWSMTNGLAFPFDYYFTFLLMTILTILVIMTVHSLKFVDETKRKLIGESPPPSPVSI